MSTRFVRPSFVGKRRGPSARPDKRGGLERSLPNRARAIWIVTGATGYIAQSFCSCARKDNPRYLARRNGIMQRGLEITAWIGVGMLLTAALPLFLCLPLWADVTLYDICARN